MFLLIKHFIQKWLHPFLYTFTASLSKVDYVPPFKKNKNPEDVQNAKSVIS